MRAEIIRKKYIVMCSLLIIVAFVLNVNQSYADTVEDEKIISNVIVPENGVIQYDVTVPAGSTVNYAVELSPNKKTGTIDKVAGVWKNTTKKTVTRTITANVKFLSSEYTISASYVYNSTKQKHEYKDKDTAIKSYEESTFHNRFAWDTGSIEKIKDTAVKHIYGFSGFVNK